MVEKVKFLYSGWKECNG